MAYYPLHIVVIVAMISMVTGLVAGWMVARMALSRLREDLDVSIRQTKTQRMELERERFNLFRSHLQSPDLGAQPQSHADDDSHAMTDVYRGLTDEINELQLENELLRQDHAGEADTLRDRIVQLEEQLRHRLAEDEAIYEDLEDTIVPVVAIQEDKAEPKGAPQPASGAVQAAKESPSFDVHWVEAPALRPKAEPITATLVEIPVFEPVINVMSATYATTRADGSALQSLLGLNDASYHILQDAGYSDVERIARLTPAEVVRLSLLLDIPAARIEMRWIPDAQMAQFSPEFGPGLTSWPGSGLSES